MGSSELPVDPLASSAQAQLGGRITPATRNVVSCSFGEAGPLVPRRC